VLVAQGCALARIKWSNSSKRGADTHLEHHKVRAKAGDIPHQGDASAMVDAPESQLPQELQWAQEAWLSAARLLHLLLNFQQLLRHCHDALHAACDAPCEANVPERLTALATRGVACSLRGTQASIRVRGQHLDILTSRVLAFMLL
jgi:hypothetical protein